MDAISARYDYNLEDATDDWVRAFLDSGYEVDPRRSALIAEDVLQAAARLFGFDESCALALRETVRAITSDEVLLHLACHTAERAFGGAARPADEATFFPRPIRKMGAHGDLFPLAVLVRGIPAAMEIHASRGIPMRVTEATLRDVGLWLRHFHARHGHWGLAEGPWLSRHFRGELFRLGRLQFRRGHFAGPITVFRDRPSSRLVVLAASGKRFTPDGLEEIGEGAAIAGAWRSSVNEAPGFVEGHPVASGARVMLQRKRFHGDFDVFLKQGSPALETHIPAEERMDPEACRRSFLEALDFFPRHFPELRPSAFTCESWLFDPQFRHMLGAGSNIIRFQDFFLLYPLSRRNFSGYVRVFGVETPDPSTAPRESALQRAILDHLSHGGVMHDAGGFVPFERGFFSPTAASDVMETRGEERA